MEFFGQFLNTAACPVFKGVWVESGDPKKYISL